VVVVGKELGARRAQIYRWVHRFGVDLDGRRKWLLRCSGRFRNFHSAAVATRA